jgi:hypothetical protein
MFAGIYIDPDKGTRNTKKLIKTTDDFILSISYCWERLDKTCCIVYYHKDIGKLSKSIIFLILFYIKKKNLE